MYASSDARHGGVAVPVELPSLGDQHQKESKVLGASDRKRDDALGRTQAA